MDSPAQQIGQKVTPVHYMEAYPDASPMVKPPGTAARIQSDEYTDSYGAFRSVFRLRGVQGSAM